MAGKTVFNSLNGKLKLEEDKIVVEQGLIHKFNNLTQFSRKSEEISYDDISSARIDSGSLIANKPKIYITHQGGEEEFRFNKGTAQKIGGSITSLDGKESAEKFLELLEEKGIETQEVEENGDSGGLIARSKEAKNKTKEYKRTCKECGETWHVLASREKKVKMQKTGNSMQQAGAALSCCLPMAALSQKNVQDSEEQLDKLRSCSNCGSHNYEEETIVYEK